MQKVIQHITLSKDEEVIQKIVAGEVFLFEILIRRYNSLLYKIARSYGFNSQDAQDLMQETHIAAYFNLKNFEYRSSYKTWLSRIMIHKCLYQLRYGYFAREKPESARIDEQARPLLTPSVPTAEAVVARRELKKLLEKCLQQLPLAYRSVFLLRAVEGFSVAETAELLNLSPVNVKVRLKRAKAMLQKKLRPYYSSVELYEFNLIYCDQMVKGVFEKINSAIA